MDQRKKLGVIANKMNRASIVGGQLHAQGSISTGTHARNLVKKYI